MVREVQVSVMGGRVTFEDEMRLDYAIHLLSVFEYSNDSPA